MNLRGHYSVRKELSSSWAQEFQYLQDVSKTCRPGLFRHHHAKTWLVPTFTSSNYTGDALLSRELLDISVYNSNHRTESFHKMIRSAVQSMQEAQSTSFHQFVADLARHGQLLRLYTQNIDDLDTRLKPLITSIPLPQKGPWPKAVQLHGSLNVATCASCYWITKLDSGRFRGPSPPSCDICLARNVARCASGKRSHGIGRLRPRITLYGEEAADGEAIRSVMGFDLNKRPDAFIAIGTSLKIPGAREFARDMCKVVKTRRGGLTAWINPCDPPSHTNGQWNTIVKASSEEIVAE